VTAFLRRGIVILVVGLAGAFQLGLLWILVVVALNLLNPCATEFDLPLPRGCTSGPLRSANELALIIFLPIWLVGTFFTIVTWRWWRQAEPVPPNADALDLRV
jgi:hypothetical protein